MAAHEIFEAIRRGDHAAVAELVARDPAAARARDAAQHGGWTPLHAAAKRGDVALAQLLLDAGADANAADDDGHTPRDLAADGGHDELLAVLGTGPSGV